MQLCVSLRQAEQLHDLIFISKALVGLSGAGDRPVGTAGPSPELQGACCARDSHELRLWLCTQHFRRCRTKSCAQLGRHRALGEEQEEEEEGQGGGATGAAVPWS